MIPFALWLATAGFTLMAWAAWELGGGRAVRPLPGEASRPWFRWTGLVFVSLAIICARAA